jgi:PAS domain S-box-containing protein
MSSNPEEPNPKSAQGESAVTPDPILGAVEANAGRNRGPLEPSRDLLCTHDLEGRLLSVNPEPARQLGYTVEELLRLPMRELVPPEFRPQFDDYLTKIAREGEAHGLLTTMARSGERRVWEYHNKLHTEGLPAPLVHGVAHDVTGRRRVDRELRKTAEGFRLLEEYAPALAMFDREMRYLYASRRWRTDYGLGDRDLRGLSHYDAFPEIPERWKQFHRRGLAGEVLREEHDRFDRADGSTQWVRWEIRPWYETTSTVGGIVIFAEDVTDITERKRAAESLRESEARLRLAQEAAKIGVFERNLKTDEIRWSPEMGALHGLSPADYPKDLEDLLQHVHPEDRAYFHDQIQKSIQTGDAEAEWRVVWPDGTVHWIAGRWHAFRDEQGRPLRLLGMDFDITGRKLAEEALRESEARLRLFIEHAPASLAMFDRDMRYLQVSRRWRTDLGLGDRDLRALSFYQVLPETPDRWKEAHRRALAGEVVRHENDRFERADGSVQWVRWEIRPWYDAAGKIGGIVILAEDRTERERAAEALRAREAELREVQRLGRIGSWYRDLKTDTLSWSEQIDSILGSDPKAQGLLTFAQAERFFAPESWQRIVRTNAKLISTGGRDELEVEFRRQDGTAGWAIIYREAVRDEAGNIVGIRGVSLDITERRRAELALRESEERMRLAQEAAKIGSFERNMQTGEGHWTPQTEEMFGLQPGAGPKSIPEFLSLIHPADRKHVENLFAESIAAGSVAGEWRVIWPDGSVHWIDGRWKVFKDEHGQPLRAIGIDSDITERKQTEEALRRSEESYRNFVAQSSEGIFRQDVDAPIPIDLPEDELVQRILLDSYMAECNGAMVKMYGLNSVGDFQGRRLTEFLDPNNPRNIELTREYIRSGFRILERESREADARGNPKVFRNSLIGIVEDGKLVRTWGIQRDVTEQVRAEEALRQSEERFRVALSGSPIAVFNQDSNLRYTWVYNLMKGFTPEDYLGKTDEEVFGPETGARMRALKQKALATGQSVREELSVAAHASRWYLDMTIEPLREESGRIVGVTSVCVDVSRLHRIANELRQAKDKLTEEKLYLEHAIDSELGFEEIIGKSDGMKAVMELVAQVATSEATVLLLGETGVGKELVARAIHRLSSRTGNAFIKMNCAAIPTGLLESELFGAEKGAYTGSVSRKIGRLELADKGTLFLDEIGEIALPLQPKLLRVLQDQEFERLGGTQTLKVNFRLIAATNRDLAEEVKRNQFRSDLFYRLNVFPIVVPPLRHRRDDIPLLVNYFVQKCSRRLNKSITSIPKKTMAVLTAWDWPGNVRELENFIERSIILTNGSVLAAPLGELQARLSTQEQSATLEAAERKHILEALRQSKGRIAGEQGAAARLGLKRTTLQSKLKQLRINPRTPPTN